MPPAQRAPAALGRAAALAGTLGPLMLAGALIGLTLLEYDFMRSLGWHPLEAPTFDWPSGLALGPHGAWMTATFLACGAQLIVFAAGLHQSLPDRPGRIGGLLLGCAGLAMAALSAPTDPTLRGGPRTPAGLIHDLAFLVLGVTLLPSMLLLARSLSRHPAHRTTARLAWAVALLIPPAFLLKGPFFYAFLAAVLGWFPLAARSLRRL
jgi:hypothetical protein